MIRRALALTVLVLVAVGCGPDKEWEAFKVAHHCKVVEQTKEKELLTTSGQVVFVDATTTWLCDDGVRYTR